MAQLAFDLQAGAASVICILTYLYLRHVRSKPGLLPPGPAKLPVIGNLLDMPTTFEWMTYHKWCQDVGSDIIHLDVLGKSIIVLDTAEAATELLEKKSSIYSGRPRMPMVGELMGWDFILGFMPYGQLWREHRRLMHQSFHPTAALRFHPQELKATHRLLGRLLQDQNDVLGHIRHMAGETILSIAYGLEVQPKNDPYIDTAERAVHSLVIPVIPGTFLVDWIPALKHVPAWMPFAGFKRKAKEWRKLALAMIDSPFSATKHNISNGEVTSSFVSENLEKMDKSGDIEHQESVIKAIAGTLYSAGSDTTVSAIGSCVLGLIRNPEALKKAQEEIDRIVGSSRLPDFDDEDSLPYISAVVKETLRWREVLPISIPHYLHTEDEYNGYRIPADSLVLPNAWAMLHSEDIYPEPFEFLPDRFMKDGKLNREIRDPAHAAFGFGRRICPGRYMAQSAIWIAVASLVATFDISKEIDKHGQVVELTYDILPGFVCMPAPFKCSIKPRSPRAEALIRATAEE